MTRIYEDITQTIGNTPLVKIQRIISSQATVLAKLEWYRQGDEQSERQWRDVVGVLTAQADCLDGAYMGQWAVRLGVADLLTRAILESGIEGEER